MQNYQLQAPLKEELNAYLLAIDKVPYCKVSIIY